MIVWLICSPSCETLLLTHFKRKRALELSHFVDLCLIFSEIGVFLWRKGDIEIWTHPYWQKLDIRYFGLAVRWLTGVWMSKWEVSGGKLVNGRWSELTEPKLFSHSFRCRFDIAKNLLVFGTGLVIFQCLEIRILKCPLRLLFPISPGNWIESTKYPIRSRYARDLIHVVDSSGRPLWFELFFFPVFLFFFGPWQVSDSPKVVDLTCGIQGAISIVRSIQACTHSWHPSISLFLDRKDELQCVRCHSARGQCHLSDVLFSAHIETSSVSNVVRVNRSSV